jgi:CHC2 zinc finger
MPSTQRSSNTKNLASTRMPRPFRAAEVKAHANFLGIVSQYTHLRRTGNQYVGRCPFHSERHASFYVHPQRKLFHCFGCGAGGDVFTFVMMITPCDFRDALAKVAEFRPGVALASDPLRGSRFGVGEGAKPLRPPKAVACHSQSLKSSRSRILAELEATNRRLRAMERTNNADSQALATACEPLRSCSVPLLEETE